MAYEPAVSAVVLAGRANEGVFRELSDAPNEALIDIAGRPMLAYVLDALTGSKSVRKVVVVGTPDVDAHLPDGIDLLRAGDDVIANASLGLAAVDQHQPALIVTSDIPLITPEVIDGFVRQCLTRPAELYYPAIPRGDAEGRFPNVKRTYAKLREGTYTGGNVFMIDPRVASKLASRAREFVAARKSPAKMAGLLGPMFLAKLLLGALSVRELEVKVSRMFGVKGVVVITHSVEIGVDVDKVSDLELVRQALAR
ncbi:MAG: NTP transferase domain-containing protein [Bacillota bacterium]|nr:NTP transferase domain-containing protein [Bacillota bacterium]